MKAWAGLVLVAFAAVLLFGCCDWLKPKQNVTIVASNQSLDVAANGAYFIAAGCVQGERGQLNCSSLGLEEKFGCSSILVPYYLGGLEKKKPLVECEVWVENWTGQDEGVRHKGCLAPVYSKYIVPSGNDYVLIDSPEALKRAYAPIETPEEAVGMAVALEGAYAITNLSIPPEYTVFVQKIDPSHAEAASGGFNAHLFIHEFCGCGNHPYYAVDYLVTRDGEVSQVKIEKVFEDPAWAGLCVD